MKLYFALIASTTLLITNCNVKEAVEIPTTPDTVYVEVPILNQERIKELEADVKYWKNVVDSINTVIPYDDFINARRAEKIKYYINICEKNPSNKKFFFGWVKRTMTE